MCENRRELKRLAEDLARIDAEIAEKRRLREMLKQEHFLRGVFGGE